MIVAISMALAAPCPATAEEVARARAAFDDAEVELAATVVTDAMRDLACQSDQVPAGVLLELYRLDGLVALSQMDQKAAVYATIRAVTVDPSSTPPALYGPELAELHSVWSERLSRSTVVLGVSGGGTVFLDGLPMAHGDTRVVVQGEHLIQISGATALRSEVVDLTAHRVVQTGLAPPPGVAPPIMPGTAAPPVPTVPVPRPVGGGVAPNPVGDGSRPGRRRPTALWILGGAALAAGGGALGWALYQDEVVFENSVYPDEASVDRAATQINIAYGTGYGLLGVGGVVVARNAVGFRFR